MGSTPSVEETTRSSQTAAGSDASTTTHSEEQPAGIPHEDTITTKFETYKAAPRPQGTLSGMPLVHHVCRKKKRRYDACASQHYQQFVAGSTAALHQTEVCGDKFEAYRMCILKGIKKEVWDKQLDLPPPGEGSPLAEVLEDED